MGCNKAKVRSGALQAALTLHNVSLREKAANIKNIECLSNTSPANNGSQWIIKEVFG